MSNEAIVQFILKTCPEVTASPNDTMAKVMHAQGRRDAGIELLKFMGRDASGRYVGDVKESTSRSVKRGLVSS